jgi:hypothetical protein
VTFFDREKAEAHSLVVFVINSVAGSRDTRIYSAEKKRLTCEAATRASGALLFEAGIAAR